MSENKTKEKILKEEYGKLIANPDKVYAQNPYIIKAAHLSMDLFADQEKRSTAIAFAEWKEAHGWYMNIGDKWYSKALKEERTSTELYDLFNSL